MHRHTAPARPRTTQPPASPSTCLRATRQEAAAFNQPLSLDTSSVTDMSYMFYFASAFNQPLSFDTSSVTDMSYMFEVHSL